MSTPKHLVGNELLPGVVTMFDESVGLGEVRGDGGLIYPFHCVEIADGSRYIEVGQAVAFLVLAKLGRHEAAAIRPARVGSSADG